MRRPTLMLRGKSMGELARRLFLRMTQDEILMRAAALSFYFIFALFPMLLSCLVLLGMFAQNLELHTQMLRLFGRLVPSSALSLIETTVRELTFYSSGWKLGLGLVAAVWSGSSGMSAVMDALDRFRHLRESRPLWKRKIIALALTAFISGLSIIALVIVLVGGDLVAFIGDRTGLSKGSVGVWQVAEWPIALLFVLFSLDLIYTWGPAVRQPWRWISPGSLVALLVWLSASLFFRVYVHYFSTYSRSYGSLGGVMVLLLWLYITGLALLLGAEINAELDASD
jgi:membrane protein